MLSQNDLGIYRSLDGKRTNFFLLNVDIHEHSKLLAQGNPHDVGNFYKLSSRFFELAVELNHGLVAPWQGDGGFAIFNASDGDAFKNVWNAASDFLVPYQNQVLRNLLNQIEPESRKKWIKEYPEFYCLIDFVELVFDFNSAGNWCGYGLSSTLKNFKDMAKPNMLAITKSAHSRCSGNEFWKSRGLKSPEQVGVYYTKSLGANLIIANPHYHDRIYTQQEDNIAGRNLLTEFLIENGLDPKRLLITALHCLAKVFKRREDFKVDGFRASVWRRCGDHLEFEWGYPEPDNFKISKNHGKDCQFQLGEGCAGIVWKTGKPLLLADTAHAKQYCNKHSAHTDESAAFFPIFPKERCKMANNYSPNDLLGVLCLGVTNKSEFKFKQEDQDIIETYVSPFVLNMALAIKLLKKEETDAIGSKSASKTTENKVKTSNVRRNEKK